MRRAVAARGSSYLRKAAPADGREFVDAVVRHRDDLEPWVYAADSMSSYRRWVERGERPDNEQYLVCRRDDDAVVGFVNLNGITGGALRSASLGWASFLPDRRRGHLTDGVRMVFEVAFTQLRLHRLEANIQPGNDRSRRLAVRCGFRHEGFSPRFLEIGGEWRDHERWAILEDEWRAGRGRSDTGRPR